MMSAKKKENFWMEFRLCSDLRDETFIFRMDDKDLSIEDSSGQRNLQFIVRNEQAYKLFQKKIPIYLMEGITQVYQEIELELNPLWRKLFFGKKADEYISKLLYAHGLELSKTKKKKTAKEMRTQSEDERNFYKQLKEKALVSELDKAVAFNEDKLSESVYLFEGQTILKNAVFFDLFQHWFDTPIKADRIDELIYHLKKKAGLLKPGPKGFPPKEQKNIIFRYEYLRIIFSKIKSIIKEPQAIEKAEEEWNKLEAFLEQNYYFQIDKGKVVTIEKWRKYKPSEHIPQNWLKEHFYYFKEIFKHDMTENEAKEEIKLYVEDKIDQGEEEDLGKYGIDPFLKFQSLIALNNAEPSDWAFYLLSKIMKTTKRQIRRIIESNRKTTQHASKVFSRMPEFK